MRSPWDWHPDRAAWSQLVVAAAEEWLPSEGLALDCRPVRDAILSISASAPSVLFHPCSGTFLRAQRRTASADVVSLSWLSSVSGHDLGRLEIGHDLESQYLRPDLRIRAGLHSIVDLSKVWSVPLVEHPLNLDRVGFWAGWLVEQLHSKYEWYRTIGCARAWQPVDEVEVAEYSANVGTIRQLLPSCTAWLGEYVRVVIPLERKNKDSFRSGSSPTMPATVFCDLGQGTSKLLELLVHESAHNCLYLCEAVGPFVTVGSTETFRSPLRRDPRPLRGILLAFHALAYICIAKLEFLIAGGEGVSERDLYELRLMRDDAHSTLIANNHLLTEHGRTFLARCDEVVANFDLLVV